MIWKHFYRAFFNYFFKSNKKSAFDWASYNLFQKSFRLPEENNSKVFIVFRSYLKLIFGKSGNVPEFSFDQSDEILIDMYNKSFDQRTEFMSHFNAEVPPLKISKVDVLNCWKLGQRLKLLFFGWPIALVLGTIVVFKKERSKYGLFFEQLIELENLLYICKKFRVKKIYHYAIFESDANMIAISMQKSGIYVTKIASEVPLAYWNKIVIADELIVCNGYQYEELEAFRDTMFVDKTTFWGPERSFQVAHLYPDNKATKGTVGFLSSASWLRKELGHMETGFGLYEGELMIISTLAEFLSKNNQYRLVIYLHPYEKDEKYLERATAFYKEQLKEVPFEYADFNTSSNQTFNAIDTAVGYNGALLYERIYFGFKTIMVSLNEIFPLQESGMRNICVDSQEELYSKLEESIDWSEDEFFSNYGILGYKKGSH